LGDAKNVSAHVPVSAVVCVLSQSDKLRLVGEEHPQGRGISAPEQAFAAC